MENYSFLIEDMTFSFSRLNSYYTCPPPHVEAIIHRL